MSPPTLLNQALALVFAPPCAACDAPNPCPLEGAVCAACWQTIPRFTAPVQPPPPALLTAQAAVGPHEGSLRLIVQALKYDRRRSIAPPLSALMREAGAGLLANADVVVPVPLHPWRQWARGFNQADLLAAGLGRPRAPVLRRLRQTPPQVDLPADERRKNVAGAFGVCERACRRFGRSRQPLSGLSVVLVDDVATTGATLEACAVALRAAGAARVAALTAARALSARPG